MPPQASPPVSPPPSGGPPSNPETQSTSVVAPPNSPQTFLQFNTDGIRTSRTEILTFLNDHKIKIAALQETKLKPTSNPISFPGYHILRKDRTPPDGGGGLAFVIHHSVQYIEIDTINISDAHLEIQAITATVDNSPIDIYNIYLPPPSSCDPDYALSESVMEALLGHSDADMLVMGDFNAHHDFP